MAKPTQEIHGPQLWKKTAQNTRSVFAVATKNKEKTTSLRHTMKNEKASVRRGKEKATLPTKTQNNKRRESSRGDRGNLGRHAAVEEGWWPHRSPPRSIATIAPRSPIPAFLGRRASAAIHAFRYPYSLHLHSAPINALDRQLLILPCRPLTLYSLLTSPSRQGFAST